MRFLRTNTAIRLTVGPFFDKTDGVTPETALTVTSCKLTLMVDDANVPTLVLDAAPTASGGANDMVHVTGDDAGFYDLELAAANVNYLGRAMLAITDAATHVPVFHEFMILPAMIYDSLVLGTDRLDTNVTHVADTAQTAGDIPARLPAALTANGNMKSSLMEILTTALTETAGLLAGGFKKFFNVATPTGTVNSIPDAVAGAASGVSIVGSAMTLTAAYDLYSAMIEFTEDDGNGQDEYTVTWFKNGVRQTSGITVPTLQVVKRADGTDLVASVAMTQIASTGSYKKDVTGSERLGAGEAALAIVGATIDGSPRSFAKIVSRDVS